MRNEQLNYTIQTVMNTTNNMQNDDDKFMLEKSTVHYNQNDAQTSAH